MKILGIKNGRDSLNWVVVQGSTRSDAVVLAYHEVTAPSGDRPDQLAWLRREILEMVTCHGVDGSSLRLAEAGMSGAPNFGRAEMDGVVQATLADQKVPLKLYKSATVRSAFGKSKAIAEAAQNGLPSVSASAKTRRDQLIVALAQFKD